MKIGKTAINEARARMGEWVDVDVPDFETGIPETKRFKLGCMDSAINLEHQKFALRIRKKYGKVIDAFKDREEEMPEKLSKAIREEFMQNFAENVLFDWEGFEDSDNKPLKYDPKHAMIFFRERRDVYDALVDRAQNIDRFREKVREDNAGN